MSAIKKTFGVLLLALILFIIVFALYSNHKEVIVSALSDTLANVPLVGILFKLISQKSFPNLSSPGEILNLTQEIVEFLIILFASKLLVWLAEKLFKSRFKHNFLDKFFLWPTLLFVSLIVHFLSVIVLTVILDGSYIIGGTAFKGTLSIVLLLLLILLLVFLFKSQASRREFAKNVVFDIVTTISVFGICTGIYQYINTKSNSILLISLALWFVSKLGMIIFCRDK